jgi:hypothetical protein
MLLNQYHGEIDRAVDAFRKELKLRLATQLVRETLLDQAASKALARRWPHLGASSFLP